MLKTRLAQNLKAEGRTEKQIEKALDTFLAQFYSKMDGNNSAKTAVLVFVSQDEIATAAELVESHWAGLSAGNKLEASDEKKAAKALHKAKTSADIAMFGRMLAEHPDRNTDGSCQVAHPISTHKVDMEMDYYTAVDDLNPEAETGAGMVGVVGFNSACYYRYALVDRDQLARNLSRKIERENGKWIQELYSEDYQEADKVIKAFLEAMVYSIPTGKQNSFAAQNLPAFGLFVRRKGGVPISLANAFCRPVRPNRDDNDLVGLSVAALTEHWDYLNTVYGEQGVNKKTCFHVQQEGRLNGLGESVKRNVQEAVDNVMSE